MTIPVLKHLMREGDGDRSFADGGRNTLEVAAAHVADRKDAGPARFEQMRRPWERPLRAREIVGREIQPRTIRVSVVSVGRSTWSSPLRTRKNGTVVSPASTRTSPRAVDRRRPCAATRATCCGVSVGNTRAAPHTAEKR